MEGKQVLDFKYTSEHFYTRLSTLQLFCKANGLDAILLIMGVDGGFDDETMRLVNWLFYGGQSKEVAKETRLEECIFVIAVDAFYVYGTKKVVGELLPVCAKVANLNSYGLTRRDAEDQDGAEIIKIGQFYKMIHDKPAVGVLLAEPDANSDFYYDRTSPLFANKVVESWPLIQAYALEGVAGSFFTIKHKLVNLRDKLKDLYRTPDSYTMSRLLNVVVPTVENTWEQCFGIFSRTGPNKRLDFSEADLAAELYLPYELGFMSFDSTDLAAYTRPDGLSHPRVLVGRNTNMAKSLPKSSASPSIENFNGKNDSPCHFTCEAVEHATSMRWARTYFLENCVRNYMKDITYTHKTDPIKGNAPEKTERAADLLQVLYAELVSTFSTTLCDGLNKKQLKSLAAAGDLVFAALIQRVKQENRADWANSCQRQNVCIQLVAYNSFGEVVEVFKDSIPSSKDWSLYVLRVEVTHIKLSAEEEDIGGICYADSFVYLDEERLVNLTHSIPQFHAWFTTHRHYSSMDFNPERVYLLDFPLFGKRVAKFEKVSGTIPANFPFVWQNEVMVKGTLLLHENGVIFQDQKLGSLFVPYSEATSIRFFATDKVTVEIEVANKELLPFPRWNSGKIVLALPMEFVKDTFYGYFELLKDKKFPVSKQYDSPKEYAGYFSFGRRAVSSTFAPLETRLPIDLISRLISIRQVGYLTSSESSVTFADYKEALEANLELKKAKIRLDTAQNKEMAGKIGVFLITGVPGANKSDLSTSFMKAATTNNGTNTTSWALINTATSDPSLFKSQILEHVSKNTGTRNLVVVMRGYHIVLPFIKQLLGDKELTSVCILRAVISKVNAMNVFRNRHLDLYPCLAENCAKGIASAIVVERGTASENRVEKILSILAGMNDKERIITLRAPRLTKTAFEDLETMLVQTVPFSSAETRNLLDIYRKYGYTFGTVLSSKYYVPRVMSRVTIKCGIPVQERLFKVNLARILGEPVKDWKVALRIKDEPSAEESAKKPEEKKGFYAADASEERRLAEYMDTIKAEVEHKDFQIERMKGVFTEEGKEYTAGYTVMCNCSFVSVKRLPATSIDREELVFTIYGNNVTLEQMREFLKFCRTPMMKKKPLRIRESLTKEEVAALVKANSQKFLPEGTMWDGYSYINPDGTKSSEHPNKEMLIDWHLSGTNEQIGEYNRKVEKERRAFEKAYY